MPASIQHLDKASQILERLVSDSPSVPDYRHLLARCYSSLSPVLWRTDPQRAAKADTKATEIFEKLVRDFPNVPDYRHELSETYARQGMVSRFRRAESNPEAEQRLRDALDIAEQLVAEHPNVPDYAASLARIRFAVGEQRARNDDVEGAQEAMQQATETQLALVERHPKTLSYIVRLALMQTRRARFLRDHDQLDAARAALDSSIASLNQIAKSSATQQGPVGALSAMSYGMLADVLKRQGKEQLADKAAQQAKQQWEQLRSRGRGGRGRPGGERGGPGGERPGRDRRTQRDPPREAGS
jgi:tetratricopeptide (TPR) repeat protein